MIESTNFKYYSAVNFIKKLIRNLCNAQIFSYILIECTTGVKLNEFTYKCNPWFITKKSVFLYKYLIWSTMKKLLPLEVLMIKDKSFIFLGFELKNGNC